MSHVLDNFKAVTCIRENKSMYILRPKDIYKRWQTWDEGDWSKFAIELRTQNQQTLDGSMRAINTVEKWHWGESALFQGSQPPITTLLQKNSSGYEKLKVQSSENHYRQCKLWSKKYFLLDENFQQVLTNYKADDPANFPVSVSHLISYWFDWFAIKNFEFKRKVTFRTFSRRLVTTKGHPIASSP